MKVLQRNKQTLTHPGENVGSIHQPKSQHLPHKVDFLPRLGVHIVDAQETPVALVDRHVPVPGLSLKQCQIIKNLPTVQVIDHHEVPLSDGRSDVGQTVQDNDYKTNKQTTYSSSLIPLFTQKGFKCLEASSTRRSLLENTTDRGRTR